jgi:hypothetical protein
MARFSDGIRRIFKGRKYNRFSVSGRAIVIVEPGEGDERKVRIMDISRGGLAFVYNGSSEELMDSGVLQLLSDDVVFVEKVHYETASDVLLHEAGGQYRRRGVKFKWLGVFDDVKLDEFIKEVRTFEI